MRSSGLSTLSGYLCTATRRSRRRRKRQSRLRHADVTRINRRRSVGWTRQEYGGYGELPKEVRCPRELEMLGILTSDSVYTPARLTCVGATTPLVLFAAACRGIGRTPYRGAPELHGPGERRGCRTACCTPENIPKGWICGAGSSWAGGGGWGTGDQLGRTRGRRDGRPLSRSRDRTKGRMGY